MKDRLFKEGLLKIQLCSVYKRHVGKIKIQVCWKHGKGYVKYITATKNSIIAILY